MDGKIYTVAKASSERKCDTDKCSNRIRCGTMFLTVLQMGINGAFEAYCNQCAAKKLNALKDEIYKVEIQLFGEDGA